MSITFINAATPRTREVWPTALPLRLAAAVLLANLTLGQAVAQPFNLSALVIHVDDGDTCTLLQPDHVQLTVRLASIDAPETSHTQHTQGRLGQRFSDKARQHLASLIKGRTVEAQCFELDRYGRSVCDLYVGGQSVSREMVSSGMAWANTASRGRYLRDRDLLQLQAQAKQAHLGLWVDQDPMPPWEWRRQCWDQQVCPGALAIGRETE